MRLSDIYATLAPAVSVEFFPPRTPEGEADLLARIPEIKKLQPAFCSVTYGAGGSGRSSTLTWVKRVKQEFGLEVMCHLTCVGQSRAEIGEVLDQLQELGVENIIALRGDPPKGDATWQPHPDGYHYAAELVAAVRARGFSVAVAGFPEGHPESVDAESEIRHLKAKVDAGADAIVTQLFFDNEDFFRYRDDAAKAGITVPIIPGILPFRSNEELRRFTTRYARTRTGPAAVPAELESLIAAAGGDEAAEATIGIDWAIRQSEELLRAGVPGIHVYCMNKSRMVEQIMSRLRESRVLP